MLFAVLDMSMRHRSVAGVTVWSVAVGCNDGWQARPEQLACPLNEALFTALAAMMGRMQEVGR